VAVPGGPGRIVQKDLDIQEYTDPENDPMIPHTLVLKPGLAIHSVYNGYWFWGRPSVNDLWRDLREVTREIREPAVTVVSSDHDTVALGGRAIRGVERGNALDASVKAGRPRPGGSAEEREVRASGLGRRATQRAVRVLY
jgi:hypothetical protein